MMRAMSETMSKGIYVFKTSVKDEMDVNRLKPSLENFLGQSCWSFDLEDCDKILRVESHKHSAFHIIELLQNFGFNCEELPD